MSKTSEEGSILVSPGDSKGGYTDLGTRHDQSPANSQNMSEPRTKKEKKTVNRHTEPFLEPKIWD